MIQLSVGLGERAYPILIDADAGAEARLADQIVAVTGASRASKVGLLTDETVDRLHRPRVAAALAARGIEPVTVVVPDGESSKSLATAERVAEAWATGGLDRRSLAVALGGGVVGDLGGFVASVFLRGIAYVQVPTTLMAQVDSSVGGKTGVNLPSGKNLAGSFHQPKLVYADLSTLATLPRRDLASGLAEIVKHGVIADEGLLALVERRAEALIAGEPAALAEVIVRSCAIKARVVADDEREQSTGADGGRAKLNFGHTVGHAIESASHAHGEPLRHGEAVALGMLAAARVGAVLAPHRENEDGPAGMALEARLAALLPRLGLPVDLDRWLNAGTLARLAVDKKRIGTKVGFVIAERVGSSRVIPVEAAQLSEILLRTKP
jgi:3-dehydroquinate synthase